MSIIELLSLVRPPVNPVDADSTRFAAVESQFGITLPTDYRDYCTRYGSGVLRGPVEIRIANLLSPADAAWTSVELDACELLREDEEWQYQVHPHQPGLFPWGRDEHANRYLWLTEGSPDQWQTVIYTHSDSIFQRTELPMTAFLARVYRGGIKNIAWSDVVLDSETKVEFAPRAP